MHLYTLFGDRLIDIAEAEGFGRTLSSRGLAVGPLLVEGGLNGSLVGSEVPIPWLIPMMSRLSPTLFHVFLTNDRGLNMLFLSNGEGHDALEPPDVSDPYHNNRGVVMADLDADGLTDLVLGY